MERRSFLQTLAGSLAYAGLTGCRHGHENRPNVVLVLVDDLGWTDVSCFGSKYYETPNIDRLCAGGMKFTGAYAACAVCSPTRSSIMTGRYPTRTGITDWIHFRDPRVKEALKNNTEITGYDPGGNRPMLTPANQFWLKHEEITIPELLKSRGYTSCHIGKWHLGPKPYYPETQGFDYNIGGCEYGQPPAYFDPYANKRLKGIPTLPPRKEGEYLTDRESDEAVRFIREHKDQPFFLYMAHYAVHSPLQAKEKMIEKYKAKAKTNQKNPVYAAMVESVDQAVGRIMATLKELNLQENTIVIFNSDNGGASHFFATDNSPLRKGKGFPYEGGIRVPLIVSRPGVTKPGSICDQPVISMDLLPTIARAAGADLPQNRRIDGLDLLPLLRQTGTLPRKTLYWHFPHYWWGTHVQPYSIVRNGDWKLIHWYQNDQFELYNIKNDIGETTDLAVRMPVKVANLRKKLAVWLQETGAKMPVKNPDYKPEEKK